MSKSLVLKLLSAFVVTAGIVATTPITANPANPSVYWVCGSCDNGIKKGPDADGKVSIKCFDPKGEFKNNGKGKIECKGEVWHCPGV